MTAQFQQLLNSFGDEVDDKVHLKYFFCDFDCNYIALCPLNDSSSLTCRNVQCIARRYKLNYYERLQKQHTFCSFIMPSSHEDERIAMQILELCDQKIDFILDNDEYNSILYYLCCD